MPKKLPSMFPTRLESPCLYLVGGHDGVLKIGQSKALKGRLKAHRQTFGQNFAWVHVFPQRGSGRSEYAVKAAFKSLGRQVRRTEVFFGIEKSVAISVARKIVEAGCVSNAEMECREALHRKELKAWSVFKAQYMAAPTPEPAKA